MGSLDDDSTYAGGNATDHVEVNEAAVEEAATWPATGAPLFFEGTSQLYAPVSVEPGAHVQFEDGGGLAVKSDGGALIADAGGGEPITFEGATASPGHRKMPEFESDEADNLLDNVTVAHAGHDGWPGVLVRSGARAVVRNSTIRNSASWGVVIEDGATLDGSNNTFENNADGDIDERS